MTNDSQNVRRHPIRVVARRTGLSRDVLRAWETRYGVVEPERTAGGQRLYSDADVERLRLMHQALRAGRRIGQVAGLPTDELQRLVDEDAQAPSPAAQSVANGRGSLGRDLLEESLRAVERMDARRLEEVLQRASLALTAAELIDLVVTPLMIEIGELWWNDKLTPGHERLASTVVRRTLDGTRSTLHTLNGPGLVIATPAGQHHEIGAMLAAAAAAAAGWRVIYMGADLPADSIATAVEMTGARAVALSIIYPDDDPRLAEELRELRRLLPDQVTVIVGGQAAGGYRGVLEEMGAVWLTDAPALRSALDLVMASSTDGVDAA
jgi:DNA-binding transcriptional MerR regulator/methylmalonyl-CoA mutase cobalamin-binding subunit